MRLNLQALKDNPLLGVLPAQHWAAMVAAGAARVKHCRAGQVLHAEGDRCLALEVILSGQLAVERIGEAGDVMTIAAFGGGDCIGGNLLFCSQPEYHLAVTAVKPTQLLLIGKPQLFSLLCQNEAFLARYLSYMADHAVVLEGKLTYYANLPIRRRILHFIQAQQRLQGSRRIVLPGSKKALAAQLGVQRSSLARVLQQMRQEGLLQFDRRSITLREMGE